LLGRLGFYSARHDDVIIAAQRNGHHKRPRGHDQLTGAYSDDLFVFDNS
jgi:hypothetical protein